MRNKCRLPNVPMLICIASLRRCYWTCLISSTNNNRSGSRLIGRCPSCPFLGAHGWPGALLYAGSGSKPTCTVLCDLSTSRSCWDRVTSQELIRGDWGTESVREQCRRNQSHGTGNNRGNESRCGSDVGVTLNDVGQGAMGLAGVDVPLGFVRHVYKLIRRHCI